MVIRQTEEAGRTLYLIKDPITRRYYRLRPPEYHLLQLADGHRAIPRAAQLTSEQFGISLSAEAVSKFYARMEQLGLLENPQLEREVHRHAQQRHRELSPLRKLVSWPLATFDPDMTVSRWAHRLRFLFNGYATFVSGLIVLAGVIVLYANRSDLVLSLSQVWQLASIPMLLASMLVIGFFHEYAHAVTLKHCGGSVNEMGFLLLYGQPSFYCNLSDAYLLDSKRRKLFVDAAGLIAQAVVTAIAILLWRILEPDSLLGRFFFIVAAGSIAIYVFNFNPLIRLDGYYMLSDLLGIANLRPRAFAFLRAKWREWTTGRRSTLDHPPRLRRLFVGYGILALLYTAALVGFITYWVTVFLYGYFGMLGPMTLYVAVLAWWLIPRTVHRNQTETQTETQTTDTATERSDAPKAPRRSRKPFVFWGIIAVLVLVSFLVRGERRVGSACRIEASELFRITEPEPGSVENELFIGGQKEHREKQVLQVTSTELASVEYLPRVFSGDTVGIGDTLIIISSNRHKLQLAVAKAKLEAAKAEKNLLISGPKAEKVKQVEAELDEVEAQRANKRAEWERARRMYERGLIAGEQFEETATAFEVVTKQRDAKKSELSLLLSGPKVEELFVKDALIEELTASVSFLEQQIEASAVLCPIKGVVSTPSGRSSSVLLEVVETNPVRAVLSVSEDDIVDVAVGQSVNLKVKSMPMRTFGGHVARIDASAIADEPGSGAKPYFEVAVTIANDDGTLRPGMTGHAKIACGKRTFASLISGALRRFLRVEVWSWF